MRTAIAIAIVTSLLFLSSCAGFLPTALEPAAQSALGCAAPALQKEIQRVTPAVLDALAGEEPNWQEQLQFLAVNGANAVMCAVGHLLFDTLAAELGAVAESRDQRPLEVELVWPGDRVQPAQALYTSARADLVLAAGELVPVESGRLRPSQRVLARGRLFVRGQLRR